jgi:hypothetical protein
MARRMNKDSYYVRWDEETNFHTLYAHWMKMEVTQVIFVDKYGYTSYMYYGRLYNFEGDFCGYTEYFFEKKGFFELEKAFKNLFIAKRR